MEGGHGRGAGWPAPRQPERLVSGIGFKQGPDCALISGADMSEPTPAPSSAWQPFTFAGVAAFAGASPRRTLAVALVGAGLCALFIVAGFRFSWLPVIDDAANGLPEQGRIRGQRLEWSVATPAVLAQSPHLQLVVNADGAARFGDESDLRVELRADHVLVCGWLGCWSWSYPTGWIIALNRPEVLPAWGAWRPFVFWGVFVGAALWVLLSWLALATVLAPALRLLGFYLDRELSLGAAWRLLLVAWLPGGLLFAMSIFLYGVQRLHPAAMAVIGLTHVLVGVVYAAGALTRVGRVHEPAAPRGNPFQPPGVNPPASNPGPLP